MSVSAVRAPARVDLPVADVAAAALFFRRVLALPVHVHDGDTADVELGAEHVGRLRTAPARPLTDPRDKPGIVVELRVPDLRGAVAELRRRGATVLIEPVRTEWGTWSAFVAGPDGMVVEVHHPA